MRHAVDSHDSSWTEGKKQRAPGRWWSLFVGHDASIAVYMTFACNDRQVHKAWGLPPFVAIPATGIDSLQERQSLIQ